MRIRIERIFASILAVMMLLTGTVFATASVAEPMELVAVSLKGTAIEGGAELPMNQLVPKGNKTGVFEAYLKLGIGDYMISAITTKGDTLQWGQGSSPATLKQGGKPFSETTARVVRIRVDSKQKTISVTPVELYLKGNIVPAGTKMLYAGHGVWRSEVNMNAGDVFLFSDKFFYFAFNDNEKMAVKRLRGSRTKVAMSEEGFPTENIRINRGKYLVELDMNQYTWNVWAPIDENRISAFGSSVCNGTGAEGNRGYAYMYDKLLAKRTADGESPYSFAVSGVSIGGNTTNNLLNRYDEMTHDFGRYVLIGLSLGNEGIHGAANQEAVYKQFCNNMQKIIAQCQHDGKIPVVMNNYTRADYNADDYKYVKLTNLAIHQWNVPSVNVLGAIDDGAGKWAEGYVADAYHQNTDGHREFMYAIPPSLFDALRMGKPQPVRHTYNSMIMGKDSVLRFCGEETVHPFTVTLRIRGNQPGELLHVKTMEGDCVLRVAKGGKLQYIASNGEKLVSPKGLLSDAQKWQDVTLTHYYAQQRTLVYVDTQLVGELRERLLPEEFTVGDGKKNLREYSELSFWRSGMTPEEVEAHHQGKCLKSSLEIYAPLDQNLKKDGFRNHAQSLNNTLQIVSKKNKK